MMQQVQQQALDETGICTALQHSALSADPRILCAAAGTCRAWRKAVQQCSVCNTAVKLRYTDTLQRLCSFSRWLPKHSGLVSSIIIDAPQQYDAPADVNSLEWGHHLEAAQQLLQLSLAAVHDGRFSLPGISSITLTADTSMLAALPAHSLTHLDLMLGLTAAADGQAAAAAIAGLSNLQQLHLHADPHGPDPQIPGNCLAGMGQLGSLTLLELDGDYRGDDNHSDPQPLVQLLSQPLPLRVLRIGTACDLPLLELSHLTQLHEFSYYPGGLHAVFPPQLQLLVLRVVNTQEQFEALMPLQQLRLLKFRANLEEPRLLLGLAQLSALQQLSLKFVWATAAAAAAAWPQLPQLRKLDLWMEIDTVYDVSPSRQQWQAIVDGVTACTNLTKLQLCALLGLKSGIGVEIEGGGQPVPLCANLAGLINLKHLQLLLDSYDTSVVVPGDALALTALTGLARLELGAMRAGVGDLAAAALAGSCTQLQHLDLSNCDLHSMACLAAARHLTQLTQLRLHGNDMRLTQQGLMLLTGLKRLKQLDVGRNAEMADEVLEGFWAAVKGQQQ